MKKSLQVVRCAAVYFGKLLFLTLKFTWIAVVSLIDMIGEDENEDVPVMFSYSDDDTRDPNNTTVTGKSYTPGQSIPLYNKPL